MKLITKLFGRRYNIISIDIKLRFERYLESINIPYKIKHYDCEGSKVVSFIIDKDVNTLLELNNKLIKIEMESISNLKFFNKYQFEVLPL